MNNSQSAARLLPNDDNLERCNRIVQIIMSNRKVSGEPCSNGPHCQHCSGGLLDKLKPIVSSNRVIKFAIPAFPFSMPNPRKTFGTSLPDRAELLSLHHLQSFCRRIQSVYPPGAQITIAADGDVFRPLWSYWFHIPEDVPQKYVSGLRQLISYIGAQDVISIWSLREAYDEEDINRCRARLLEDFPVTLEQTRARVKQPDSLQNLAYLGQKKYFYKDGIDSPRRLEMSGSKLVRKCGELASEAIHLADAWSHRIAREFPDSIRLSVHPYPAHFSERIGIFLTETKEEWMTPWHGVAAYWESTNRWEIMKNYKAQELGARLVCRADGQPDHYIIDAPSADIGKH